MQGLTAGQESAIYEALTTYYQKAQELAAARLALDNTWARCAGAAPLVEADLEYLRPATNQAARYDRFVAEHQPTNANMRNGFVTRLMETLMASGGKLPHEAFAEALDTLWRIKTANADSAEEAEEKEEANGQPE